MEGKRTAAIVALCMFMLLSGQLQQVAATSKFCACFECLNDCRKHLPVWFCVPKCLIGCIPNKKVDAPTSAADCHKICPNFICGTAVAGPTYADAAAACVDDCTKNWSLYANKHT